MRFHKGQKGGVFLGAKVGALVFGILVVVVGEACADVVVDMTLIGNPGNASDTLGFGSVNYQYQIATFEFTVSQYTEFLNAAAKSDPYGLYNDYMGGGTTEGGYIARSGSSGSYSYGAVSGTENQPVRWVSLYDALRLCNWMYNGQGDGDTESGSYDMSLGAYAVREPDATWVIPSQDEWYKAAYYDPVSDVYYDYPDGTDNVPTEPTDGTSPRTFNFGDSPYWAPGGERAYFTSAGDTTGQSPYGTFDQGGNVEEWTDTMSASPYEHYRIMRGGHLFAQENQLLSTDWSVGTPDEEGAGFGFRLAYIIPEPSTVLLGLTGALLIGLLRRRTP